MNEPQSDFDWLQQFARAGCQDAFRELVHRHLNLVFGTAMRKVGDAGGAEEVAQNVFGVLARKAWQFDRDDSLPAWLHRTAMLEAQAWVRGEMRRRRREQTAAELGTTMKTSPESSSFNALVPMLDEALLSLREKDRTVLLLRFYEKQSLNQVGQALGITEDTAQKRVARALEKLCQFFQRRGYRTATVMAAAAALEHTSATASAGTAAVVLAAALKSAPTAGGLSALLARVAALTKAQTAAICLLIAAAPIGWQWHQKQQLAMAVAARQTQLAHLQTAQAAAAGEQDSLRARLALLEGREAELAQTRARLAGPLREIENIRTRVRALLGRNDYHWPDDLPFVRVPKWAVPAIKGGHGEEGLASLTSKIHEYLDLNMAEHAAVDQIFTNYSVQVDQLLAARLYETNRAAGLKLPENAESRVFVLQPTMPVIRDALAGLCANLATALGGERWSMVTPDDNELADSEQTRLLKVNGLSGKEPQEVAISIMTQSNSEPLVVWTCSGGGGSPMPLRQYVADNAWNFWTPFMPHCLIERASQYCCDQAKIRLQNLINQ